MEIVLISFSTAIGTAIVTTITDWLIKERLAKQLKRIEQLIREKNNNHSTPTRSRNNG